MLQMKNNLQAENREMKKLIQSHENGGSNVEESVRQEGRQRVEPVRPHCLATQL